MINNNKCNGLFAVFSDVNDELYFETFSSNCKMKEKL